jgi:hypothetical protein
MESSDRDDGMFDPDVVEENYLDDQGIGTLEVAGASEVQLMLDEMQRSSDNFLQEWGDEGIVDDSAKTPGWKYDEDHLCDVVLINHVDKRNLSKAKELCELTIQKAKETLGIARKPTINDCLELFLDRCWYFLIENLINIKLSTNEKRCSLPEVLEVQRVWLLQMIDKQSSHTLFKNENKRWGLVTKLDITEARYTKLIRSFKTTKNESTIKVDSDVDEENTTTDVSKIWGNLLEQDELPRSLEEYVGKIGRQFIFDSVSDCSIDDDKLRHSSRSFRSAGIAMTGFRGSRIGPVMNGLVTVQTGIIHAIHFNRFTDNPLSITTALLNHINYGSHSHQKNKLDVLIAIDRGYNYKAVTDTLTKCGMRFLGTHSEKFDKWPFSTTEKVFPEQRLIPVNAARSIYVARKKVTTGEVIAHCFRNGVKAFGNVFTTEPVNGQWVLNRVNAKAYTPPTFTSAVNTKLHERWLSFVIEITEQQAIFPWFECRTGCLTGTTTKNVLRCVKFLLLDDTIIGWEAQMFFKEIGITLKRPSDEDLKKISPIKRKKRYVALGYSGNATNAAINEALKLEYPHDSLVYERLVKSWCMAPIKTNKYSQTSQTEDHQKLKHRIKN